MGAPEILEKGIDGPLDDTTQDAELISELEAIVADMKKMEGVVDFEQYGKRKESARNLLDYLGLRLHDVRDLQAKLELLGLSSLGRSEGHVLYNVEAVLHVLKRIANREDGLGVPPSVTPVAGRAILKHNADVLLGPLRDGRQVRIMVTMPYQAAIDYELVRDLLASGMDIMRINCGHDSEKEWAKMIGNLRRAEKDLGRECRLLMDIAGPKLRTGSLSLGPRVVKWRPKRDRLGHVTSPARVWLTPTEHPAEPHEAADVSLRFPRAWLAKLESGTRLRFEDARGANRSLKLTRRVEGSWWAESNKTAYVSPDTKFVSGGASRSRSVKPGGIAPVEEPILLNLGDRIILTGKKELGRQAKRDGSGKALTPASVSCTLPEALAQVKVGEHLWLDDGKMGGIVKRIGPGEVEAEMTVGPPDGMKLAADKGINLPDTDLKLPALTRKDVRDLRFIARHADIVGYSFVRNPDDVESLRKHLKTRSGREIGIVLKIETKRAFEQLPSLLLAAMKGGDSGVMIARGDLAVECGYERLAEVQEEILWLCEAAHMPAIWATQVLEGMAKNGYPSRAEVTDAAMGERAECVMLNKGPYIVGAVRALDSILRRMQDHQLKKSSMLRHLRIADAFLKGTDRAEAGVGTAGHSA